MTGIDVNDLLARTLGSLQGGDPNAAVAQALQAFASEAVTLDPLNRELARRGAIEGLKALEVGGAASLVNAALATYSVNGKATTDAGKDDPEPATEPQDGASLLTDVAAWIRRYVYFPDGGAAVPAVAAWSLASWCVDRLYFAPLLVVASPTKCAGKTTLLDLVRHVVRRGHLTSAFGATGPVIFRLNQARHPTFLLDEAERLGGRDADRDVVNLLNQGHRRGGYVDRCREQKDGGFEVERFEAFGFRALALIGKPWDTLLDRGVVVRLERKPPDTTVARFAARTIAAEGRALAARIARWAADNAEAVGTAEQGVPRPTWLRDRACDNWSPLFSVGAVAGGAWPARLEAAAKALQGAIEDDGDRGEHLLHDLARIFASKGTPAGIATGQLLESLNGLEESPWADERGGKGLSPQRLAALLRPFRLRPCLARDGEDVIRGYWWADLAPVAARYPVVDPSPCISPPAICYRPISTPAKSLQDNGCNGVSDVTVPGGDTYREGALQGADSPEQAELGDLAPPGPDLAPGHVGGHLAPLAHHPRRGWAGARPTPSETEQVAPELWARSSSTGRTPPGPEVEAIARARLADRVPTSELLQELLASPPDGIDPATWWAALDALTRRDEETGALPSLSTTRIP